MIQPRYSKRWFCTDEKCCMPPSPEVVLDLYSTWKGLVARKLLPKRVDFEQYFLIWLSEFRGENFVGLDDGQIEQAPASDKQQIQPPATRFKGVIRTLIHAGKAAGFMGRFSTVYLSSIWAARPVCKPLCGVFVRQCRPQAPDMACGLARSTLRWATKCRLRKHRIY